MTNGGKTVEGILFESKLRGDVIFSLKLDHYGNAEMVAPNMPPEQICSFLLQTAVHLMFQVFERKRIVNP